MWCYNDDPLCCGEVDVGRGPTAVASNIRITHIMSKYLIMSPEVYCYLLVSESQCQTQFFKTAWGSRWRLVNIG